jgi:hypothetical protein
MLWRSLRHPPQRCGQDGPDMDARDFSECFLLLPQVRAAPLKLAALAARLSA